MTLRRLSTLSLLICFGVYVTVKDMIIEATTINANF